MLYLLRAFRGGDFSGLAAVEGVELAFRFLIQVINAGVNVVVFIGIAIADLFPQVSLDGVVAGFFAVVAIVVIVVVLLHPPGQLLGGQAVGKGLGELGTVSIIHAADIFLGAKIHGGKVPACGFGGLHNGGTALGEVPVGAVVAKDGEIIARAHNLRESGKNATYHAELMAIDAACKALGGWRLWQCELFVTLEPCPMCSGAIINSRLKRVVYGARDPKAGCCGSLTDLFALPFNHHPVIESGLLEEEAQALLQDFFAMLREKRKKK